MRRLTVALLFLILLTIPLYSQQSSEASSGSTISFTSAEWAAFEAQVQAELERTALEAAEEAVKPYILVIEKRDRQLLYWKMGTGAAVVVTLVSLVFAALK